MGQEDDGEIFEQHSRITQAMMAEVEEDPAFVRAAMQADVDELEADNKRLRSALIQIEDVSFECDDALGACIRIARSALAVKKTD
jgi:hypothetical protein